MSKYLSAAEEAKLIRKMLKKQFPGQTFYVRSSSYSMGSSINISWLDGPTEAEVEALLPSGKQNNSMEDYSYTVSSWQMPDGTFRKGEERPHKKAVEVSFTSWISAKRVYSETAVNVVAAAVNVETGLPIPEIVGTEWWVGRKLRGDVFAFQVPYAREEEWKARTYVDKLREVSFYKRPAGKGKKEATAVAQEGFEDANYRVEYDRDWTWVYFDKRPLLAVREALSALGFSFSKRRTGWYAKQTVAQEDVATAVGDDPFGQAGGQDSLIPAVVEPIKSKAAVDGEKLAAKFNDMADRLDDQIARKRNSMSGVNMTARRAKMQASAWADADHLEDVQKVLRSLAELWAKGSPPKGVDRIRHKKTADALAFAAQDYAKRDRYSEYSTIWRWKRAGSDVGDREVWEACVAWVIGIFDGENEEREKANKLRELQNRARLVNMPGFFPTPSDVQQRMFALIRWREDMKALEPQAGDGQLADGLMAEYGRYIAELHCVEWQHSLREILTMKGYEVVADDFLEFQSNGQGGYDLIVMNPPFEQMQDVDHVLHAYDQLADEGQLVSVMSESPFFRKDGKAEAFRNWLDEQDAYVIDVEAGAFKESGTGVKTRIVYVAR